MTDGTGSQDERRSSADESDLTKVIRHLRETGIGNTIRRGGRVLVRRAHLRVDRNFDRDLGVHTSSQAYSWDLTMKSEGDDIGDDEPMYLPTSSTAFRTAMARLPRDLSDFVFVDYGSGMGRTLLLASSYGFRRIIGVEFAAELHEIAKENIGRYEHPDQSCFDIHSEHVDATVWSPPDDKCVFYFFHPFEQIVMDKVMSRIRDSYLENPREMYFVYYKPVYREVFESQDFVVRRTVPILGSRRWIPNPYELELYESVIDGTG